MATSEPVEVAVEILDEFSDELNEIERRLNKIDGKRLDVELDIDAADIEAVQARLEQLEREVEANLDIDVSGYEAAKAMKADLERDMRSTLHLDVDKDRLGGIGGDLPDIDGIGPPPESIENTHRAVSILDFTEDDVPVLDRLDDEERTVVNRFINEDVRRLTNEYVGSDGFAGTPTYDFGVGEDRGRSLPRRSLSVGSPEAATEFLENVQAAMDKSAELKTRKPHVRFSRDLFSPQPKGRGMVRPVPRRRRVGRWVRGTIGRVGNTLTSITGNRAYDNPFENIGDRLKSVIPTMRKWWQLIALAIPVLITLAGAALGAAAALGALAAAGALMVGIGILGYGDSLTESLTNFRRHLSETKKDVAGILQPVGDTFQPFLSSALDKLPALVNKFVDPLQRLQETGFDTFFLESLGGVADWFSTLIGMASELAPEIQAIGWALASAFGNELLKLLRWSVLELYRNWDAFASLANIVKFVIVILYNVSKAVSFALTAFEPLFRILAAMSDLLSNQWVMSILAALMAIGLTTAAVLKLAGALSFLAGIWAGSVVTSIIAGISWLYAYIKAAWMAVGANAALAASLAAATMGLSVVAGGLAAKYAHDKFSAQQPHTGTGYTPPATRAGMAPTGGGYGTQINIYGDVGDKEYQKLKDEFPGLYSEQRTIEKETEK
jgi:hypothetical protein